jgi:excisionase family DNA binding protein
MGRGSYGNPIADVEAGTRTAPPKKRKKSRFLSTQEAAEYLGVSDTTFRKYRNMGKIPFRKVGMKLYKYEIADLDAFARKIEFIGASSHLSN